jgi:splicing factor 3B subunit 2
MAKDRAAKRAAKKARKRDLKEQDKEINERLAAKESQHNDEQQDDKVQQAEISAIVNDDGDVDMDKVDIVYVPELPDEEEELAEEYRDVFKYFTRKAEISDDDGEEKKGDQDEDDEYELDPEVDQPKAFKTGEMSNKQKKRMLRMKVANLKQSVLRPELVEIHDPNSMEPELLIFLKGYRNAVPVPQHWSQKRKYLQGKRGFVKPPFALPKFIEDTGIAQIRNAQLTQDDQSAKQKQREKMQPKMGRLNLDYQVLHDAFFKFQTKPRMTKHGELYYEGKEFEVKLVNKRPGQFSDELKIALGMRENTPPPWLVNMQRFGPPPSYPGLRIPGLNSPIPPGCLYGYEEGRWGKPPVDQYGNPVYGDPFGVYQENAPAVLKETSDKMLWGEIEDLEEEEEVHQPQYLQDEEEEDDDDMDIDQPEVDYESGIASVSSLASGLETPETVQLRKRGTETPDASGQHLYQVLQQQQTSVGSGMFGSSHTYVYPQQKKQ